MIVGTSILRYMDLINAVVGIPFKYRDTAKYTHLLTERIFDCATTLFCDNKPQKQKSCFSL